MHVIFMILPLPSSTCTMTNNRELVIKRYFNLGLSCAEIAVALEHAYLNFFFIFFTLREYKPLCSDFDLVYRDLCKL